MKLIKLFSVLLALSMLTMTPASIAANKADKQKQAQQKKEAKKADKKQIQENKKNYKEVEKPKLKERKAENKKEQKQAKQDRKQALKNLDQPYQELVKFAKARNGAKAVLLKQHQQMQAAIKNYNDNPSPKTLNARDKLIASYANSYKNYQEGPRQKWLDKVNAFNKVSDKFNDADGKYKKTLEDGATIARDKIKAKAAIKNTKKPVEASIYDIVPTINSSVKIVSVGNQRFVSTRSAKEPIYGPGPPLLPIYDRVSQGEMLNYGNAGSAFEF